MRDRFFPNYVPEIRPGPMDGRPRVPGRTLPPNPGEDREGGSPFGRLARGCALGKSSILVYDASAEDVQEAGVDMIVVEGDDLDACQMIVTLAPPRVIPIAFADLPLDSQNLSGEMTNVEVGDNNFPGTGSPVAWPPLEVLIEWGVKGARAAAVADFVNGMTISVVASYLRVRALVTQSEDNGGITGTSAAYYLAAFVGPGMPVFAIPRRTVYVGQIANANESAIFTVPKFAQKAYVVGSTSGIPPIVTAGYLRFFQDAAGAKGVGDLFINGNQPTPFDVPNGAMYFAVYNQSGSPMSFAAIFELAL